MKNRDKDYTKNEQLMIDKFLKKNKPSTLFKDEEFIYLNSVSRLGSNSSVLGA